MKRNSKARGSIKWLCLLMAAVMVAMLLAPMLAQVEWPTRIDRFERYDPVYTAFVEPGTAQEDLRLPEHLRAVISIGELDVDPADFVQAEPEVDMSDGYTHYDYFWYGYVAPRDVEDIYAAGELAVYTILYADQGGSGEVSEIAYRVYGSVGGSQNVWFACDEAGNIHSVVLDVPVTWSTYDFDPDIPGEYTFTADIGSYSYAKARPTAVVTVGEMLTVGDHVDCGSCEEEEAEIIPCVCGQAETGHTRDCPYWNPDCLCPEGAVGHTNPTCPYWVPLADCDCGIDSTNKPWQHNTGCPLFEAPSLTNGACSCEGSHDKNNKDCILYQPPLIMPLSIGGGGANDLAQDQLMRDFIKTSGNSAYSSSYTTGVTIPGVWADYVNTIWMNKAYNKFAWTPASEMTLQGPAATWSWDGTNANATTGSTATTPKRIPAAVSNVWTVYSGQQLRYALINFKTKDTIVLGANIDLNGNAYNWSTIGLAQKSLTINGNNKIIYNLGNRARNQTSAAANSFIANYTDLKVTDLQFSTAKLVGNHSDNGTINTGIFALASLPAGAAQQNTTLTNVHIIDSMFCAATGNFSTSFGRIGIHSGPTATSTLHKIENCSTVGSYIYGGDHTSGLAVGIGRGTQTYPDRGSYISDTFVADTLICGTGGHSSGFSSCTGGKFNATNCFTSIEMYGSVAVSGFIGICGWATYESCFATGKLEGYAVISGFYFRNSRDATFQNCYSTVLTGLRTNSRLQGGFASSAVDAPVAQAQPVKFINCYAAGEVGNFDSNMNNPVTLGGFIDTTSRWGTYATYTNCYYDKQTTAMREWAAGDSKSVPGVTGVLTTTTAKAGTGLTDEPGATGFTGFSTPAKWDCTEAGHYPELEVFKNATATGWGTQERADLVKAYSLASTATVMLDTWDDGFDWNSDGVRTGAAVSYARTLPVSGQSDHKGNELTYDTVREIVSPFTVTGSATFGRLIPGGAPSNHGGAQVSDTIVIDNGTHKGDIVNPGMDWYGISETVGGQTGKRPIRLMGYMNIDAGTDTTIYAGALYDHRGDVQLTILDSITENLVVGLDDTKIWSKSIDQGYPASDAYYGVVTDPTQMSASEDAWLYTEIWRVQYGGPGSGYTLQGTPGTPGSEYLDSGNYVRTQTGASPAVGDPYVLDASVKVTGPGTMGPGGSGIYTLDQQKWNGEFAMWPDISIGSKYELSYYWMLSDGRYRTDRKIADVLPGKYTIGMNVIDADTLAPHGNTLYLGADKDSNTSPYDPAYTLSPGTISGYVTPSGSEIPYTDNATAAWKIKTGATADLVKLTVTLKDAEGNVMGTGSVPNPTVGSNVVIPVKYYYTTLETVPYDREVTEEITVDVTYTVAQAAGGEYYLRFNKLLNPPAHELPAALAGGVSTGIASTGMDGTGMDILVPGDVYINDMMFNTEILLEVRNKLAAVRVKKAIDNIGDFSAGDQAALADYLFFIQLKDGVAADIALKHNETSKLLYVPITGSSLGIDVSEIVRMEFLPGYTVTVVNETGSVASVSARTVTVHPGDEVTIVVHNTFKREPYFKARDQIRNKFTPPSTITY